DPPLDRAAGEAVVPAAFEEVAAVHDEGGRPQRAEVGQARRAVVEGRVYVRCGTDLAQVAPVGGHGVTSQMSAPRVWSLPGRSAWPRRSWSRPPRVVTPWAVRPVTMRADPVRMSMASTPVPVSR